MSDTCQTISFNKQRGFSLVELTVVLVLMSLATAMVAPNLSRAYNNFQIQGQLDEMQIRLHSAGFRAFEQGKSLTVTTGEDARQLLQPGDSWQVEVIQPLVIRSTGICLGGEFVITSGDVEYRFLVDAPFCEVKRDV